MFDDPIAAFLDETFDSLLGLTCDVPFVWKSVADCRCSVCVARLDRSSKTARSLSLPCSALGCGFVLRARGRLTTKDQ
jgi:hypothetical protein